MITGLSFLKNIALTLDIDGRPSLSSFQSVVAREEIAAIDPDFVETEASIPDGMR
jgi:hypothetical protein